LHKRLPRLVARARHYAAKYGFAAAAIDAPGHGDRPHSAVDEQARADFRRATETGEGSASKMEPPRLSFTFRMVSSSKISRASGSERASRSSLVTTRVSPARQAARASRRPGPFRVGAGQAVVDVDAIVTDPKRMQPVALGGEILLFCGYACVPHE
jgi:hypothetical protein